MARMNKSRYAVLGVLAGGAMSGYEIKQCMERSTQYFWSESPGQIYPILRQLESEGLVALREEYHGARLRKIYSITKAGLQELSAWLTLPADPPRYRIELFLKLFFGRHAPKGVNVRRLQRYQQELLEHKALCERALVHVESEHKDEPDQPYWLLSIRRGQLLVDSQLVWCEEALSMMEQLEHEK
jgi:PadR family transcriptional regulator AphA